ncbi:glycoside hydrolase family 10 protein [Spirulina subsalsa]|uniref:glycoside hydrolase family 10 protein n=1 Tax=Spirulina subsalsa TaxID=54311 RepID=UPI0002F3BB49|nr:family 10 glycosylhydrolase [Spirulina subsalsa]
MKTLKTTATVTADGMLIARTPNVSPGGYQAVIALDNPSSAPLFPDIRGHWAQPFIEALARQGIITGFPDGTFRPNQAVNRAQFAALIQAALRRPAVRPAIQFRDVAGTFWAAQAINNAYTMGFISGFPNQEFRPHLEIPKVQVLVALANGLRIELPHIPDVNLTDYYLDAASIPAYAIEPLKNATRASLVVNHPNVRQLSPNQPATRGEVAAMIYQAMVYSGQVGDIFSNFIVSPPQPATVAVSHQREFRGVWVPAIWNRTFPSKRGMSTAEQQAEIRKIADAIRDVKLNAVCVQIRPEGDALYASGREPWTAWLSGVQGQPPHPFYDPLEMWIQECHARNIEFHAWFNPYRARSGNQTYTTIPPHIGAVHPEAVLKYGNEEWMDPGQQVVIDRTCEVILDVVRRYDVDGIQIDDYIYPYPIQGVPFPDQETYRAYQEQGGTLSLANWRRDNVNRLVERLAREIRQAKAHVKFGISPFGIYRPGEPEGIRGLSQFDDLYSDPKKWLAEGWVDYMAPQLYWKIDPPAQSYPVLLKWWTDNNPRGAHIYVGNNVARLSSNTWDVNEFERQVEITRGMANQRALGNIFYYMSPFLENWQGLTEAFKSRVYVKPALVPLMAGKPSQPPMIPARVRVVNGQLSWDATNVGEVRAWSLYQQVSGRWELRDILPSGTRRVTVPAGTYGVSTVNRLGVESEAVVVTVR